MIDYPDAIATTADPLAGVPALDRDGLERKAELEERHWWFRGRHAVVDAVLARLPVGAPCEVLDLGAGTGHMLDSLARFGPVSGVDVNPRAVEWARAHGRPVREAALERLPFEDRRFGLVTCLDVLEHVEDDAGALAEARRVARGGALLVVTVPAYPRLFSRHDEAAGHLRRYTRRSLVTVARTSGWRPLLVTGFNALLLPVAASSRLVDRSRRAPSKPGSDLLRTPRFADPFLLAPLKGEARLLGAGARLPFGLSLLAAFEA